MVKREKRRFVPTQKFCSLCLNKVEKVDYKDLDTLRRFISDRGKIEPRRRTGTCARHQRMLSSALKRARYVALLPYTPAHIRWSKGVGLKD